MISMRSPPVLPRAPLWFPDNNNNNNNINNNKLLMMMILVVMVVVLPIVRGHNTELCVVETPLRTSYVNPLKINPTSCLGCLYPTSQLNPQVHIIDSRPRLPGLGGLEVVVGGSGGKREIVVVLVGVPERLGYTVRPLNEAFTKMLNGTVFVFVVSEDTKIHVQDMNFKVIRQTTTTTTTSDLISSTRRQFGQVTSYTRSGQANRVILRIKDEDGVGGAECKGDTGSVDAQSSLVECQIVEKVEVSGCFHTNMLGGGDRDIHIIDLTSSNDTQHVELVGSESRPQNVTLVLRSGHATTWHLHTTHLEGTVTLLVGGTDQVENMSVPGDPGVALQVRKVKLPATFDQLILSVLTNVGPPVSYTRTSGSTHIILTVARRNDNHISYPSQLTKYEIPTEEPASIIRAGLSVSCGANAMTLALPYSAAERVGGVAMALLDRACVGSRNGTHIVLKALFSQCRFKRTFVEARGGGGRYVYTNLLSVELGPALSDDEDLGGSGYGSDDDDYPPGLPSLRVTCKGEQLSAPSKPPLLPPLPPPPPPPSTGKEANQGGKVRGASYTLTMFTDPSLAHPLVSSRTLSSPTAVTLNSHLYVQAALASVLPWGDSTTTTATTTTTTANLRVVLEECWISNTTTATTAATTAATSAAENQLLLRKSCRIHPSVAVTHPHAHSNTPTFSFQVLPEFATMDVFYLNCRLGVCSPDTLPRPAVIRCIEPALYCSKPALLKVFNSQPASSSLQTLTIGPLTSASTTKSALQGGATHTTSSTSGITLVAEAPSEQEEEEEEEEEEDKAQIVVLRGLSTEIVVGIALASFVIGVCLTATLWVIHMKTDPRRQKRQDTSAPRNSGYDLSAHSGSSTPSSQAPMTA